MSTPIEPWHDDDLQRIQRAVRDTARRQRRRDFWRVTFFVAASTVLAALVTFVIVPRVMGLLFGAAP